MLSLLNTICEFIPGGLSLIFSPLLGLPSSLGIIHTLLMFIESFEAV